VTFTGHTDAALTAVVVTNTAGAVFGTALPTGTAFTGGAGADTITLTSGFTKAITLGAGNDTVTYASQGTGGSVAAGDGTGDTIIMTLAEAESTAGASSSAVFNSKFTGFEALTVSDSATGTIDMDGINAASTVNLSAAVHATGLTLNNFANNGTAKITTNASGALAINVKSAIVGATDVLNLVFSKSSALTGGTITVANVETINIAAADSASTGSAAAINTLTLAATSAKSVVLTGNNGLTLVNTGNVAITNFDASSVVANSTLDTAGVAATTDLATNLAVTFASANTTAAALVTIKGGAGDDTLSGTRAIDTITGGAGIDTIYADNIGSKAVTA